MPDAIIARPPKLPFWRTVGQAYATVFRNLGIVFALARPWLQVLVAVTMLHSWWVYAAQLASFQAVESGVPPPGDFGGMIAGMVLWLAQLVPMSAIAVGWHRFLLRDEQPYSRSAEHLGGPLRDYAVVAAGLGLICYLPLVAGELITPFSGDEANPCYFLAMIGLLVVIAITTRLSMALPAIALEAPEATLSDAWRVTHGNMLRLLLGTLLTAMPSVVASIVLASWFSFAGTGALASQWSYTVLVGSLSVVALLLLTISVGFLSFAWRHFYEGRHEPA